MTAAATAQGPLADVFSVLGDLVALLEKENAELSRFRFDGLATTVQRKATLGSAFNDRLRALRQDAAALAALPAARRAELGALTRRLQRAAADNAIALQSARDANQRLMTAIVQAVERRRAPPPVYGRRGQPAAAARTGTALLQDQRL
jgi:flagellar biosynthesis/type III secretory pathway chaperone